MCVIPVTIMKWIFRKGPRMNSAVLRSATLFIATVAFLLGNAINASAAGTRDVFVAGCQQSGDELGDAVVTLNTDGEQVDTDSDPNNEIDPFIKIGAVCPVAVAINAKRSYAGVPSWLWCSFDPGSCLNWVVDPFINYAFFNIDSFDGHYAAGTLNPYSCDIAMEPSGDGGYVTNPEYDDITRVGTGVGSSFYAGGSLCDLVVTPDGRYLLISAGNSLKVVDPELEEVVASIDLGGDVGIPAVASDGSYALATAQNTLNFIALEGERIWQVVDQVPTGNVPTGVAIDASGEKAYVTNSGSSSISVIDLRSRTVERTIQLDVAPGPLTLTPAGDRALLNQGGFILIIDTATGAELARFVPPLRYDETVSMKGEAAIRPNRAPKARFAVYGAAVVGAKVTFNAKMSGSSRISGSYDSDGKIVRYHWSFGDGEEQTTDSPVTEHRYSSPGSYKAKLRVEDDEGGISGETVSTGATPFHYGEPSDVQYCSLTISPPYLYKGTKAAKRVPPAKCG